jgi:hypothetical protein
MVDAKKEAIEVDDQVIQTELKENYLRHIPKLGINV